MSKTTELTVEVVVTVSAKCRCGFEARGDASHKVRSLLTNHLQTNHPVIYAKLAQRGREMAARSENGCGYYDRCPKNKNDLSDWGAAREDFRRAWIEAAVKEEFNVGAY